MKRFELFLMVLHVPVDFFMLVLAGMTAYALRFMPWAIRLKPVLFHMTQREYLGVVLWVSLGWIVIFALAGLYSTDPNRKLGGDIMRVFLSCSAGLAAVAMYVMFAQQMFDSRFLAVVGWGVAIVYVCIGRISLRGWKAILYRFGAGLRRVAVIGDAAIADVIVRTLQSRRELGYRVIGVFSRATGAALQDIHRKHADEILLVNPRAHEDETLSALDFCQEHQIVCKYFADLFSMYSARVSVAPLAGIPVVELRPTRLEGWGRVLKRLFDIIASAVCIIAASPLFLVAAVCIAAETGWPVLFRNERIGWHGKIFYTLKFRSMYQSYCIGPQFTKTRTAAERFERELIAKQNTKEGPIYKIANDPRVTKVGKFLRRWSFDELPQFFNVLCGSMSMVGPRPHQPREVAHYEARHKLVLHVKPGITGLAQISGRSDLSFDEEIRLDVLYMEEWNLLLDIIVLVKTPFVLFRKRKAL